ncbi:MAG: phosphatidylglycerophosphatase A [Alphaproteobacteria bacterium]|nr:phosphatidylglycerophosphatase A [Alphaproteobacteria bacterium]
MALSRFFVTFFVSGCGVGFLPKAPGTWGSLFALFLFWGMPSQALPLTLIALFFFGYGAVFLYLKTNNSPDPQEVVIDEIIGQGICLLWIPHTFMWWFIAFGLFRLFDIKKPFPVSWADQLKGPLWIQSLAVLLDDIIAGLMVVFAIIGVESLGVFIF